MMTERIFELAKALGHVGAGDEDVLRELCVLAEQELSARLREGVSVEGCEAAFRVGAAWLALSGLCVGEAPVESFTAGGLTIKRGSGSPMEHSAALRGQSERVMAPYLKDGSFSFLGVRG